MSGAFINSSISGLLTVTGTTTLGGALTSASTLNTQAITTTGLTVNGLTTINGALTTLSTITSPGLTVNGNFSLTGSLITSTQTLAQANLNNLAGSTSNIQAQLDKISINNLQFQTTGTKNLALGFDYNMASLTTGTNNVGVGIGTLQQCNTGSFNVAVGHEAGMGITGSENVCIGRNAGIDPANSFTNSICIGKNTRITASNQTVLGTVLHNTYLAGSLQLDGSLITPTATITNIQLARVSGATSNLQTQLNKISINNGLQITSGIKNLGLGDGFNLQSLTIGNHNVALGISSLQQLITGNSNIAVGHGAGQGILNDFNICIGKDCGIEPANTFTNSICIGKDTRITASNQTVLGTVLHNTYLAGSLQLDGSLITPTATITNAQLARVSGVTSNIQTQFDKISINNFGLITSGIKNLALGDYIFPATTVGSYNIGIGNDCLNQLQSGNNNIAIGREAGGGVQGSDIICIGYNTGIQPQNSYINSVCIGKDSKIYASNQIVLGTDLHKVKVSGAMDISSNLVVAGSISESITGTQTNFYRKTGCGLTETHTFSIHGLYQVIFNNARDRTTSSFFYVDVLNNVSGGSYITLVNQGTGMTSSIAVATNILTITSTTTGGVLLINRLMTYP